MPQAVKGGDQARVIDSGVEGVFAFRLRSRSARRVLSGPWLFHGGRRARIPLLALALPAGVIPLLLEVVHQLGKGLDRLLGNILVGQAELPGPADEAFGVLNFLGSFLGDELAGCGIAWPRR